MFLAHSFIHSLTFHALSTKLGHPVMNESLFGKTHLYCTIYFYLNFQVKIIKFKHPVHDIQANKNIVVITFLEKLAVFDASTLEDTFTVTTCYPSPGPRYFYLLPCL